MRKYLSLFTLFCAVSSAIFMSSLALADEIVTCKSHDYKYTHCRTGSTDYVKLQKQLSKSRCEKGRNWDYDRHGIWVDEGCKAEFLVMSDKDDDYRRDDNQRDDYRHDDYKHNDRRSYNKEVIAGVTIFRNVLRNGTDYKSFSSGNVKRCAEACADDHRCKAFNFGKKSKNCHLKDNVPNGDHNNGVISGVKNR